jgi:hypothetical protein
MWVERGGRVVIKRLLRAFESGYSLEEVGIHSGDQILVPERGGVSIREILNYLSFGLTVALVVIRIREVR